jgi:protein SCO1/2
MRRGLYIGVAAAAAAVAITFAQAVRTPREPRAGPAHATIPLTAGDGRQITLAAFRGDWVVLLFGYRSCPDVCPTSLAYLASELRRLDGSGPKVHGVFVSADPDDRPGELGAFVRAFDPEFVGLTGGAPAVKALAQALGGYFAAKEPSGRLAHSGTLHILDRSGNQVDALSPPFAAGELASKLSALTGRAATH